VQRDAGLVEPVDQRDQGGDPAGQPAGLGDEQDVEAAGVGVGQGLRQSGPVCVGGGPGVVVGGDLPPARLGGQVIAQATLLGGQTPAWPSSARCRV